MTNGTRFADNENHLFLAIEKLEFEIMNTGFNSTCLQIKGWNLANKTSKPDVIIIFDSPECWGMKIKDVTKQQKDFRGNIEIESLIDSLKEGML